MKTKNIKKMISITWNLINSIVKWVLPRANYVFPIVWVVFVVFFYKAIDTSISYSAEGQLPPVCQESDLKIDQDHPLFLLFGPLDCSSKIQEQAIFRDRVILITYIATMLFVLLFFKQKKNNWQ